MLISQALLRAGHSNQPLEDGYVGADMKEEQTAVSRERTRIPHDVPLEQT